MLPSRDMAEIPLKRRKSSIQRKSWIQRTNQPELCIHNTNSQKKPKLSVSLMDSDIGYIPLVNEVVRGVCLYYYWCLSVEKVVSVRLLHYLFDTLMILHTCIVHIQRRRTLLILDSKGQGQICTSKFVSFLWHISIALLKYGDTLHVLTITRDFGVKGSKINVKLGH